MLHLDEKTPHVQAFVVPINERGKLSCKSFFDSREQLRAFQKAYAEKMAPLGLERGVEGSRATHLDVKHFYGAIKREVSLVVLPEHVPDPPRMVMTEARRREYKAACTQAVLKQLREPINTLHQQAQLTREERGRREAAEQRAAQAEGREQQWKKRCRVAEQNNHELRHHGQELFTAYRSGMLQNSRLTQQVKGLESQVLTLNKRLADVPLVEVMEALGYRGERRGQR